MKKKKIFKIKKENQIRAPSYEDYQFRMTELVKIIGMYLFLLFLIVYLFYGNLWYFVFLAPLLIFFLKIKKENLKREKKRKLNLQFKDCMISVSTALNAGYSIENAWKEAYQEMCSLYGEKGLISIELQYMVQQISINRTTESLLFELADRSGIDDIKCFAEVFCSAKRSGGNLLKIIQFTTQNISDKIEVKREITTVMSSKRFEQKIMNMIPCAIILYVNISSPGFLTVMYETVLGKGIMTGCLLIYMAGFFMAEKITNIEV